MRRLFVAKDAGMSAEALRWALQQGKMQRIAQGVYAEGPEPPTALELALASVIRTGGVARGSISGALMGLDSVEVRPEHRRRNEVSTIVVHGIRCADGRQTLIDLAATLDDDTWEQALECALRKRLGTLDELADTHIRLI